MTVDQPSPPNLPARIPMPGRVLTRLPLAFRVARWWSVSGPRRGRWRIWELAARLSGRGRVYETRLHYGATVLVDLSDPMSRYPVAYGGMTEHALHRAVRRVLSPGDTFVDVGANFGHYCLLAGMLVGPSGAVHAFEPQSSVAALLAESARRNGMSQVNVHQMALGDEPGTATMYVPRARQSGLGTLRPDAEWLASMDAATSQVRVARLDDLAGELGLERVRAIKVDAEGYEAAILRGARELLVRARPIVFFEEGPGDCDRPSEAVQLLRELGYHLWRFSADGPVLLGNVGELDQQQNLCALMPEHGAAESLLGGEVAQ